MGKIVYQKDNDGNRVYPVTVGDAVAVNGQKLTTKMTKLDGIEEGAQRNTVTSVQGRTGDVVISKTDVGLDNVTNDAQVKRSEMGVANGVATLDGQGKVPSSQLPSYVDDVMEYDSISKFPLTGEAGKIYVDKATNKTYRWSGSTYVEISASIALGETSSTAYAGDKGKANAGKIAAHVADKDNPHSVTKEQVGLGNVGNYKAVSVVQGQGLTDSEKQYARQNIGAGTSNFSGSYNDLLNKPTIPTTLPASDTTSTYEKQGTAPVNGKAVHQALGTLSLGLTNNSTEYSDAKVAAIIDVAASDTSIQ